MKGKTRTLSWLVFFAVLLAGVAGCSPATTSPSVPTSFATSRTIPQNTSAAQATSASSASSRPTAASLPTAGQSTAPAPASTAAATSASTAAATSAAIVPTTPAATVASTAAPPASCTISVACHTAVAYGLKDVPADGIILAPVTVPLLEGDTVLTVLVRAVSAANPAYGKRNVDVKSGAYVSGIGNDAMASPLYEKDCGPESGWLFYINGVYVSLGASARLVRPGETVEWKYTCASGRDLG